MKKLILISFFFALYGGASGQSCPDGYLVNCEALKPIVYPTPANDQLNFRFKDSIQGTVDIKLYDFMGRIIDKKRFAPIPADVHFDIGNLRSGIYLYEVKNDGAVITRDRFIKQ